MFHCLINVEKEQKWRFFNKNWSSKLLGVNVERCKTLERNMQREKILECPNDYVGRLNGIK